MKMCLFHPGKKASHVRDEILLKEDERKDWPSRKIGLCSRCAKTFKKTSPRDLIRKLHFRRIDLF